MNTKLVLFNILAIATLSSYFLFGQGGGPLNPPTAPADGTYRTLGEIYEAIRKEDPRTPIRNADLPLTITEPGSYIVTENLQFTETTGDAITLDGSNITLDFLGFSLSSAPAVTGNAIRLARATNCVIKNGSIAGQTTVSESFEVAGAGFAVGIYGYDDTTEVDGLLVKGFRITGCRGDGISLQRLSRVEDCVVSQCGNDGVRSRGSVFQSQASRNARTGICAGELAIHCIAISNGRDGITSDHIDACAAERNQALGLSARFLVSSSVSSYNGRSGIAARNINGCTSVSNAGGGLEWNTGGGYDGATFSTSYADRNGATNIVAGSGVIQLGNHPAP